MNKLRHILLLSLVLTFLTAGVFAQAQGGIVSKELSQTEIDRIVKNFTNKEREFRNSFRGYIFNRDAVIQTVSKLGGQITGEYRRDSLMTFTESGERIEKILKAPIPTLTEITVTPADIENLGGLDPFAIEPELIDSYRFTYVGKERIDELDLYVFDVAPKVLPDAKKSSRKFFSGRVWVDDRDMLIVKSKGKALPEAKGEAFPIIETWRENVDGKYWFPSYSTSDDELVFDNGQSTKIRIRVKYSDYTKGKTDVRILDDDEPEAAPAPTPKKP